MKDLTVIVRGFTPADEIEKCLDSLLAQAKTEEILICIKPDDEKTLNRITDYTEKYDYIRFIEDGSEKISDKVNKALKEADGKYILILNADEILTPNAAEELINGAGEAGSVCNISVKSDDKPFVNYNNVITFGDAEKNISLANILFSADIIKNNNIEFEGNEQEHELLFILRYLESAGAEPAVVNKILVYRQSDYRYDRYRLEFFCEKSEEISKIAESFAECGRETSLILIIRHIILPMYLYTLEPKDDNYQCLVYSKMQKILKPLCENKLCCEYLSQVIGLNPVLVSGISLNHLRDIKRIERPEREDYDDSGVRNPNGHDSRAVFAAVQKEFELGTLSADHLFNLIIIYLRNHFKKSRFNVFARKVDWTIGLRRKSK